MTPFTTASDRIGPATPAPPRSSARNPTRSPAGVLADPRVRLAAGTVAVLATAAAARRNRVSRYEATAFRAVNGLPDSLYPPAWVIMQLGTLGAAPASAGAAWLAGDRELAGRLLAGGAATWALSKLVKRMVRRPGRRSCSQAPAAAAPTRPAWDTRPGMPASPSLWALPLFHASAQPPASSP